MKQTTKDNRDKLWAKIELDIQKRGNKKDKNFRLTGKWKKFVRKQGGFKVYAVDGTWIRNNLSVIFGHGGHGLVHEFIPLNEIWISMRHYSETKWNKCPCRNIKKNQPVSKNYFDSCTVHEITEFKKMKKNLPYWTAHNMALEKERELGLLPDPDTEIGKIS